MVFLCVASLRERVESIAITFARFPFVSLLKPSESWTQSRRCPGQAVRSAEARNNLFIKIDVEFQILGHLVLLIFISLALVSYAASVSCTICTLRDIAFHRLAELPEWEERSEAWKWFVDLWVQL